MTETFAVYHEREAHPDLLTPDPHQDVFSKTILGFWMYLMTDCVLFGSLFATYAVLHNETFGGPTSKDLFELSTAFTETMILLVSSLACGLALLSAVQGKKKQVLGWLATTFLLGSAFLAIELHEFRHLVLEGNSWQRSAFLSSFFTLVGTHGAHITTGLLWTAVMMTQVAFDGITTTTFRRLVAFSLFWHFLDLIWVFIFTFVYLMGVI